MGKVIPFPGLKERRKKEINKEVDEIKRLSDLCIDSSVYLHDCIEEEIKSGGIGKLFTNLEFRDETYRESRDMFVIVNLLNAMFTRHTGIPHILHRDLDRLYIKIKKMAQENEIARELMIEFLPEDFDDTD